jgi:bifunctional non-homologous end joining protein LigD
MRDARDVDNPYSRITHHASRSMSLKEYKAKRNFRQTREPSGKTATRTPRKPLFVVQKHDATRLHYDFRLAMEGVLKSWAVPKGFPTRRGDRRLAVQVEDHPMCMAAIRCKCWSVGNFI